MNIFSGQRLFSRPQVFLLACCVALTAFFSNGVVTAQELSREETIKEAGRLGTEAERIRGEAFQKIQAGGDQRLRWEAERAAAEKLRQALELWRAAGDDDRLVAAAEEISRVYSVLNDYENTIGGLRREVEYWRGRGDLTREIHMNWLIGIRQMQMRRNAAAIKTFEEVIEASRAANLITVEANTLDTLAGLYERTGRAGEAPPLKARARELFNQMHDSSSAVVEVKKPREPLKLPSQWLDLPAAPLVGEYRDVEGVRLAVLVNRSTKGIEMVSFGCVTEQDGKARVVGQLGGMGLNHGGVGPGNYYDSFGYLNGPLNRWTNEKMHCEGKAKMAVVKAVYADRTEWDAEGTDWPAR